MRVLMVALGAISILTLLGALGCYVLAVVNRVPGAPLLPMLHGQGMTKETLTPKGLRYRTRSLYATGVFFLTLLGIWAVTTFTTPP